MLGTRHAALAAPAALALGVAATALGGCSGSSAQSIGWTVEFETAETREAAVHVEALIREGGCRQADPVLYGTVVRRDEMLSGMKPPALPPGDYGFAAIARNAECEWVATGCQNVELPAEGPVVVTLGDIPPAPACRPSECTAGRCEARMPDAGGMDAGTMDAGGMDAGTMDAGADDAAIIDAGGDDAGTTDAGGDAALDAGGCTMNDAGFCSSGGTSGQCWGDVCCTGCWDGVTCRSGTSDSHCGMLGAECTSCPSGTSCTDGFCRPDRGECDGGEFICPRR